MSRRSAHIGPVGYAVVVVLLVGYFVWILDRMAAFSARGFLRLDKLAIGFGLVIAAAVVVGVLEALSRRRRATRGGRRVRGSRARSATSR